MAFPLEEEATACVKETICCTRAGEGVTCLLPDGSNITLEHDNIARSRLLVELLNATAVGAGFELPVREGIAWLECRQTQADQLQHVDDTRLVEFLKASEYFQDSDKLRELYFALGTRLFEAAPEPLGVHQPVDLSINPDISHPLQQQVKVLQALTPDQATEVLRNSPYCFEQQFRFLPAAYRYLAAHAAIPGILAACNFATKPSPPESPKNPVLQLASWGLSLVQPVKAAFLTLVVDGCQYVEPPDAAAPKNVSRLPELPESLDLEADIMAGTKIWPESSEPGLVTNEDLEKGLFSLMEGTGVISTRMLVKSMCIADTAFQLKQSQAILFDSSCAGLKIKNVTFEGQEHSKDLIMRQSTADAQENEHVQGLDYSDVLLVAVESLNNTSTTQDHPCESSGAAGGVVVLTGAGCYMTLESVQFIDTTLIVTKSASAHVSKSTFLRQPYDGICLMVHGKASKVTAAGSCFIGGLQGIAVHAGGTFEGRNIQCDAAGIIGMEAKDRGSYLRILKNSGSEKSRVTNVNAAKRFGFYPSSKGVYVHSRSTAALTDCDFVRCNGRGVEADVHEAAMFTATRVSMRACDGIGMMLRAEKNGYAKLIDCSVVNGKATAVMVIPLWPTLGVGPPATDIRIQGGEFRGNKGTGIDVDGVDGVRVTGAQTSRNDRGGYKCSRSGSTLCLHRCTSEYEDAYTATLLGKFELNNCVPSEGTQAESLAS